MRAAWLTHHSARTRSQVSQLPSTACSQPTQSSEARTQSPAWAASHLCWHLRGDPASQKSLSMASLPANAQPRQSG